MEENKEVNIWDNGDPYPYAESKRRINKHNRMIEFLEDDRSIKILDFGCGDGDLLERLYNNGYENITGVDWSNSYLATAKKRVPSCKLLCFDITDEKVVKLIGDKFDVVYCTDVLHHVLSGYSVIDNMIQLLKINGVGIIIESNALGFEYYVAKKNIFGFKKGNYAKYLHNGEYNCYSPRFFEAIIRTLGGEIVYHNWKSKWMGKTMYIKFKKVSDEKIYASW